MKSEDIVICACAKDEDRYLEEWLNYHYNIGVDRIVIYDNNDDDRLLKEEYIQKFIESGKLELIPYYNKKQFQLQIYYDFIKKREYKWCAFIDIDEFITLNEKLYTNLKDFFKDYEKRGCNILYMSWMIMTGNHKAHYENKPVLERFTEPLLPYNKRKDDKVLDFNFHVKTFLHSSANCYFKVNPHSVTPISGECIYGRGCGYVDVRYQTSPFQTIDYSVIYLRHYITKSREEYLDKLERGNADIDYKRPDRFFEFQNDQIIE